LLIWNFRNSNPSSNGEWGEGPNKEYFPPQRTPQFKGNLKKEGRGLALQNLPQKKGPNWKGGEKALGTFSLLEGPS